MKPGIEPGRTTGTIRIARRFRGPPNSANGGYACGRLAAFLDGPAEVTLHKPPPLETDMTVVVADDGGVALYDGEQLVASARIHEHVIDHSLVHGSGPAALSPSFDDAVAASRRSFDPVFHKLPMCYVCGPDRAPGDGLRIFCGPLDPEDSEWDGPVAAPWIPEDYMADDSGHVSPEYVWAALDCPTAFAAGSATGFPTILLGRQAVTILRQPAIREPCIITARQTGRDGRKYFAQASLHSSTATLLAHCRSTWIEVPRRTQLGSE